jgi:hypothetical protein
MVVLTGTLLEYGIMLQVELVELLLLQLQPMMLI